MRRIGLIRHARPFESGFVDDHSRTLTPEGKKIHQQVTLELEKKKFIPTKIISSPKIRALETAKIMGTHFHVTVETEERLNGNYSPYLLLPLLQEVEEGDTLFIVTHMPLILELATLLAEGKISHSFPQSSVTFFEFSDVVQFGQGTLLFHLEHLPQ